MPKRTPSTPRATLKGVAAEAQVGVTTAADILRGEEATLARYNPETVARVRKAARALDYRPNRMAAALVSGRSRMVMLLAERAYEPFFARVARHLEECARADGYEMFVVDAAHLDPAKDLSAWPADGILAAEGGAWSKAVLHARPSSQTPVVSFGTSGITGHDRVLLDVAGGMKTATEHLVAKGCRRIVYLDQKATSPSNRKLTYDAPFEAHAEVMKEAGLKSRRVIAERSLASDGRNAILELSKAGALPDAVLCRTDDLALGVSRALYELGVQVGRDTRLVGCNGMEEMAYLNPPVSSIELPVAAMAATAWAMLRARMEGTAPSRARSEVLPVRLEIRESSGG